MFFSNSFLYWFTWSSNQLLNLNIFSFFYLPTRFFSVLTLEYSAIHWLTCFRVPGWFLCFFGCYEYWLPCILVKLCHVPHASWIITWGTIFIEPLFSVSQEWVRSWSHAFLIAYDKTWLKSFWQSVQKKWREGKK